MIDFLCPHCRARMLKWESDEEASDIGYYEEGIVSYYHCDNCGVHVEIYIPRRNENEGGKENDL